MPTGYTADIANGVTFKEYALTCARAFGACIELRDSPLSDDIPEFTASPYYAEQLKKHTEVLAKVQAMTDANADEQAKLAYEQEVAYIREQIEKANDLRTKYENILLQVNAWTSPSPDHDNLKEFMRTQLTDSIKFDCDTSYYTSQSVQLMTGKQWKEAELAKINSSIKYATESFDKENATVARNNAWVKALKESL